MLAAVVGVAVAVLVFVAGASAAETFVVAEAFVVVASAPEFAADGGDAVAAAFVAADSAGGVGFAGLEGHTAEAEQMSGAGVVVAAAGVDGK